MGQWLCVITGFGVVLFWFVFDDVDKLYKKIDKVIELIEKEREFVEYIECPNCAELTWNVEFSVCKNCNFVD